jgi:glycosyltransferase involved in cell wall biosynthesis
MLKIMGFVEGAFPDRGGVGIPAAVDMLKSLAHQGHQVVVMQAGSANPAHESLVCPDVRTASLRREGAGYLGVVVFRTVNRWAFAPSILRRAARYTRNVDFITLHSLYSFPVLAGYLLARFRRKPYGLWLHGVLAPVQRQINPGRKKVYDWLIGRRILNQASALVFSAPGEYEEVRELGLLARSVVIPHGFDTSAFEHLPPRGQFRARYLGGFQGPLVLYLSRLNAKKGLDVLAQAFALILQQIPESRLAIVGRGDPLDYETKVRNWLRQAGVEDRTIMTGLLVGQERLQAFADADVFVLPSQSENFGFAMFEAMASRIPVVVSDTLNYAIEIQRHESGIAVPRTPQEFAQAIVRLLNDPGLRQQMGYNGLQLAQAYSWEACGVKVERTIRCILDYQPFPADLTLNESMY